MERYYTVDHTADIALVGVGETLPRAFENVAFGMFSEMADLEGLQPEWYEVVEVAAPDQETLVVSWLRECLLLYAVDGLLLCEFHVEALKPPALRAQVGGVSMSEELSVRIRTDIKAVTYHGLEIRRQQGRWEIHVVLDI